MSSSDQVEKGVEDDIKEETEEMKQLKVRFKLVCQKVLSGKGHWEFRIFASRKCWYLKSEVKKAISYYTKLKEESGQESKHIEYVLAYLKYEHSRRKGKYQALSNLLTVAVEAGSDEANIDLLFEAWNQFNTTCKPIEARQELIRKFPDNAYLLFSIANNMIPYDYDEPDYPKEHVDEAVKHLEHVLLNLNEDGEHDYVKYKLCYLYIKYTKQIELGIRMFQEAETRYGFQLFDGHCNIAYYWRHRTDSTNDFLKLISKYKDEIVSLKKVVQKQGQKIVELTYAPGAPGYLEAKAHFEMCMK